MAGNEVQKLQFLVSISLLSLLLFYSLSHYPSGACHSTMLFSLIISRAIDRKCMFVVCNCILVFLVKTSSCGSSSPAADQTETLVDDLAVDNVTVPIVAKDQEHKEERKEERKEDVFEDLVEKETEEMEVTGKTNEEILSAEELNRKVEEFIRKMKEEMRIEAQQQQLIAV